MPGVSPALSRKDAELADLKRLLESMKAAIATLRHPCFGHKSEKVVADGSQPLLPGMEGLLAEEPAPEQPATQVKGHERRSARGQKDAGGTAFRPGFRARP